MEMNFRHEDRELISLGRALHQAALEAKSKIDALPVGISVDDECVLIDAASAPVFAIVEWIEDLPTGTAIEIKAKAAAWLAGSYWSTHEELH